jgi:acetyl esterase
VVQALAVTSRFHSGQAALDPQVREVLQYLARLGHPPLDQVPPPEARRLYRETRVALRPPAPVLPVVGDLNAEGTTGLIPLRLYRPSTGVLPVLIFFHGGGWVVGDLDTHDVVCRQLASQAGVIVIAVDYRLAPEHPFPAAVDDCWSATTWIAANAIALGIDSSRIAVAGDSAGGGLAAVMTLMARSAGPDLKFQILVYPVTDLHADSASYSTYGDGYVLTRSMMQWYIAQYAPQPDDARDWRASPLLAPSLSDLPPALVVTAGVDPLRDEGEAYARRLEEAGVPVDYVCLGGMIHGFLTMGGKIDAANHIVSYMASALRQKL